MGTWSKRAVRVSSQEERRGIGIRSPAIFRGTSLCDNCRRGSIFTELFVWEEWKRWTGPQGTYQIFGTGGSSGGVIRADCRVVRSGFRT